jgi:hypothetical protein
MAFLGHVILAGGSYATLRDLADYGATLCFDDAEAVMDIRRADPDKRTLLLAGNRRGAYVTLKESDGDKWVTRHVHTFCPRAFSAIRLPDEVLSSRSIVVPLIRSGDPARARANPLDRAAWPCDRRELIDDLWALGLANLPELPAYDAKAANRTHLMGRDLEPWRVILGVALWLEERHKVEGLFTRMKDLVDAYQEERSDLEVNDPVRIAIKAFRRLLGCAQVIEFAPKQLADAMHAIAVEDDLAEAGADDARKFTTSRKVGWMLKRLRFKRGQKKEKSRPWIATRGDVEGLARAYGMGTTGENEAVF